MKQFYLITILLAIISLNVLGQEGWTEQTSPSSLGLSGVYAIDSLNVWAVGQEGLIIHTTDGGNTWDSIPSGTSDMLMTVEFINADTGWVGGSNSENETRVYRTTDGGLNWVSQILDVSRILMFGMWTSLRVLQVKPCGAIQLADWVMSLKPLIMVKHGKL